MKLIRFADLAPKPWKNGGGTTTEIAVSPEGADFEDFDWRLSIADVASDGPFSLFPNIDRTLTVIEGKGLAMTIDGGEPLTLTPSSSPLSFPGDVPVEAHLVRGAIRDFNVMTRRGRVRHAVSRHNLADDSLSLGADALYAVLSLEAGTIMADETVIDVSPGDVALFETGGTVSGSHNVLVAQLRRVAPGLAG
jgi:uncharacterized protein